MSADNTYLIKSNKCLEQYTPPEITGDNAYITVDDTTANLSDIITAADEGVTMYIAPPPMGTAQGYPVDISALTGVPAIVTIIKPVPNYAQINFGYNGALYFTHCYIGQSGAQLSTWQQVNTTAV